MEDSQLGVIEGLLFLVGNEGLELAQIAYVLDIEVSVAKERIETLQAMYEEENRGLTISQFGQTYQMTTKKEHANYYQKLMEQSSHSSLSQAALETLAIVTYRQPITRMEIEEIRGVNSDRALKTLISKLLVKEVGRAEKLGKPRLYGTTKEFLNHFGLQTLEELPPLPDEIDVNFDEQEADLFFSAFQEQMFE